MEQTPRPAESITTSALPWKPPWEVTRESSKQTLTSVAYDPAVIESFFEKRPERGLVRTAQVWVDVLRL